MNEFPKVSVVVLSWNNLDMTLNCMSSLLVTDYPNFEIVLVDQGSESEAISSLKKNYSKNEKIKLIFNGENVGSAEGRNIGFRNSSEEAKYVAFFDNDTILPKEYIGQLVNVMETNDNVYGVNGSFSDFPGGYPGRNTTLTAVAFDAPYFDKRLSGEALRESVALTGSGCMYDKKFVMPEPFFADYFFGGEEIYVGLLVYLKGGKCMKVLDAPYTHLSQNVFQRTKTSLSAFHATKNRLMSLFLFFDRKTLIKLFPLIFVSQIFYFFYFPKQMGSKIKSYSWLIKNFGKIKERKEILQKERRVNDKYILNHMSGKFQDSGIIQGRVPKKVLNMLNSLFVFYCKLFRIPVKEVLLNEKRKSRLV